jgi:hypothetical protein
MANQTVLAAQHLICFAQLKTKAFRAVLVQFYLFQLFVPEPDCLEFMFLQL